MSANITNKQRKGPSNNPKPKRPPLTHFLCLPLINSVSLPQLESSLISFKASIPPIPPSTLDKGQQDEHQQAQRALIPDDAIRPVGTLHLTLGVMSLPTPERLDEALQFFRSLDLVDLMRKAEESAAQKRSFAGVEKGESLRMEYDQSTSDASLSTRQSPESALRDERRLGESTAPEPFNISLESIHALPRARSASVLHAAPVDSTSRLYPFCEALRDKFLEAGFLHGEYKTEPKKTQKKQETGPQSEHEDRNQTEPSQDHPDSVSTTIAEYKSEAKLKPRPLLLHATIVNTIYIRGRKRNTGGGQAGGRKKDARSGRFTFDARAILSHYRNFYLDSDRTIPRSGGWVIDQSKSHGELETIRGHSREDIAAGGYSDADAPKGNKETQLIPGDGQNTGYPFVWARNIPIEGVCICEMGAKKLDQTADKSGMNARLGEKYKVVAERSLDS
ncbi:AKAP7 2'5' RNA ligase-like domain-containing protein [Aspergillus recurvatus]